MDFLRKISDYIKSARLEAKNVSWPTRGETMRFTFLVIGISIAVAAYLGFMDFIFAFFLKKIIS